MFNDIVHLTLLRASAAPHDLITFGGTQIDNRHVAENWTLEDGGAPMNDAPDNQGMFNNYAAIHAYWPDTTYMDNIRGPGGIDGQGRKIAGTEEYISAGNSFHTSTSSHDATPASSTPANGASGSSSSQATAVASRAGGGGSSAHMVGVAASSAVL